MRSRYTTLSSHYRIELLKVKIFKYLINGKVKESYHLLLSNLYAENNISVNWMAFIVYSLENIHMASREKPFSLGKTTKNLFCRKSNHETVFKNAWWVSLHDLDLIGLFIIVLTEISCLNNLLIYEIIKFYQAYNAHGTISISHCTISIASFKRNIQLIDTSGYALRKYIVLFFRLSRTYYPMAWNSNKIAKSMFGICNFCRIYCVVKMSSYAKF